MKLLISICLAASMLFSQVLYEEYFTGGMTQLDWHAWYYDSLGIGDSMLVLHDTTTPGGDDWAGRISNEYMGMAGMTYAGIPTLTDYSVEAWIYTLVTTAMGSYNGIAIRMNTGTTSFYSLVSDFDNSGRLLLRYFVGASPTVIREWLSGEIPGGVPSTSSWHKMKLTMIADSIWAFYDDVMLPGCPFIHGSLAQGYFGVYVFNMADTSSTKCDNIIVRVAQSGLTEHRSNITPDVLQLSVTPNPFSDKTRIAYCVTRNAKNVNLQIYDINGRLIKDLARATHGALLATHVTWDGTDNANQKLPSGVYFVNLSTGDSGVTKEVIILR